MRDTLIAAGVKNLKRFGYPKVNADNIITDRIYSAFFKSILQESKGVSITSDQAIDGLIAEIANHN